MEEENLSMIHTIDEGIDFHQKLLNDRIKQLEGNNTSGREIIEKDKVAEENKIRDLQEKKEKLLEEPRFLFLIASESDKMCQEGQVSDIKNNVTTYKKHDTSSTTIIRN